MFFCMFGNKCFGLYLEQLVVEEERCNVAELKEMAERRCMEAHGCVESFL